MELLKIKLQQDNQDKKGISAARCFPPTTYKDISLKEKDLEDLIATFPALLNLHAKNGIETGRGRNCVELPDRTSELLIVSRQPIIAFRKRPDLVALDEEGNLHCIELKRDREDSEGRQEAFEFQAIRYAAEFSRYKCEDIIDLYADYLSNLLRGGKEYALLPDGSSSNGECASRQLVRRIYDELDAFLKRNEANYNKGFYCHMSMLDKELPDFDKLQEDDGALRLLAEFGIRRFLAQPSAGNSSEMAKDADYLFPRKDLEAQLTQSPSEQRIYLVAGSFEPECLAACSWLLKSGDESQGVQIFCFQFTPYYVDSSQNILFALNRILPLPGEDEFVIEKREQKRKTNSIPAGVRAEAIKWKGIKYGGFGEELESKSGCRGNAECVRFFCDWLLNKFVESGFSAEKINGLFGVAPVWKGAGFLTLIGENDSLPNDRGIIYGDVREIKPAENSPATEKFRAFIFTNLSKEAISIALKKLVQTLNAQNPAYKIRLAMLEPSGSEMWLDGSQEQSNHPEPFHPAALPEEHIRQE